MKQRIDMNGTMANKFCLHGIAIQNAAKLGLAIDVVERDMQSADYKSKFVEHFGGYFDLTEAPKTTTKFKRNKPEK